MKLSQANIVRDNKRLVPGDPIKQIANWIGNTPLYKLKFEHCNLYTKLEYYNAFGSIKDRPALYILSKALKDNLIDRDTTVIESTSGNFGIALAGICKFLGIKFIPVIDPAISGQKENILRLISYDVIKVGKRDDTGGFLLTRIAAVNNFLRNNPRSYNANQYQNPNNYLSYYYTLGQEICDHFSRLDYAFICVSSGGTIIGLSQRLKERFPYIKIIAVDIEGSLIFSEKPCIRKISGLGSSMRSSLMESAIIDEVIILSHEQIIQGAYELLHEHSLFLGASSGAAYMAANLFLKKTPGRNKNAIFISPDNGSSYLDTIYSKGWLSGNCFDKLIYK